MYKKIPDRSGLVAVTNLNIKIWEQNADTSSLVTIAILIQKI